MFQEGGIITVLKCLKEFLFTTAEPGDNLNWSTT